MDIPSTKMGYLALFIFVLVLPNVLTVFPECKRGSYEPIPRSNYRYKKCSFWGYWNTKECPIRQYYYHELKACSGCRNSIPVSGLISTKRYDHLTYKYFPVNGTSLSFRVKTTTGVLIALSSECENVSPMYEILIGWGRLFTTLWIGKTQLMSSDIPIATETGVWISWRDGIIKVGQDGNDTAVLIYNERQPLEVRFFGLGTIREEDAKWEIYTRKKKIPSSCKAENCGPYSSCSVVNGKALCVCLYDGSPPACSPPCSVDYLCPGNKYCSSGRCIDPCEGVCGENAVCSIEGNMLYCDCVLGYSGNPLKGCTLIATVRRECTTDNNCARDKECVNGKCRDPCEEICGQNSVCIVRNHKRVCDCSPGYQKSNVQDCVLIRTTPKPECESDGNCPDSMKCSSGKCTDPCPGFCGENALCSVSNHEPNCDCPEGYDGNPSTQCTPAVSTVQPECITDDNCAHDKECVNEKCRDPCEENCGQNSICIVRDHKRVCDCSPGYQKNNLQECELPGQALGSPCTTDRDCVKTAACYSGNCSDPCILGCSGVNSECNVTDHQVTSCSCLPGMSGDPTTLCSRVYEDEDSTGAQEDFGVVEIGNDGTPKKQFKFSTQRKNGEEITTLWYYNINGTSFKFAIHGRLPLPKDQMIDWLEANSHKYMLTPVPPPAEVLPAASLLPAGSPFPDEGTSTTTPPPPFIFVPRPTPSIPWYEIIPRQCGLTGKKLKQLLQPDSVINDATESTPTTSSPWLAIIINLKDEVTCGGSIITDRHILTATNCFVENTTAEFHGKVYNTESVVSRKLRNVLVGDLTNPQRFTIRGIYLHTWFTLEHLRNDIALIVIDGQMEWNLRVFPICLPNSGADRVKAGQKGVAPTLPRNELASFNVVEVEILPKDRCKQVSRQSFQFTEGMLCASNSSPGDPSSSAISGGGLTSVPNQSDEAVLIGISSGSHWSKQPNIGLYTNVEKYMPWIRARLEVSSDPKVDRSSLPYDEGF